MPLKRERGIALVVTLFLMSVLSALAASLMFLSQTETYASMNYKMMSLARYGAEAGVERASNFLYDHTKYTRPTTSGADLLSLYERVRAASGGVGAARLYQRRCEGCRLELNATERGRIRAAPDDAVIRCEECGRILVRTPDSGL